MEIVRKYVKLVTKWTESYGAKFKLKSHGLIVFDDGYH